MTVLETAVVGILSGVVGGAFVQGARWFIDIRLARRQAETEAIRDTLREIGPIFAAVRAATSGEAPTFFREQETWWTETSEQFRAARDHWFNDWEFAVRDRRIRAQVRDGREAVLK